MDLLLIAGDLFHRQPLLRELKDVDYENFDYIFNDEKGIFVDEVFEALNEKYKLEDYKNKNLFFHIASF